MSATAGALTPSSAAANVSASAVLMLTTIGVSGALTSAATA